MGCDSGEPIGAGLNRIISLGTDAKRLGRCNAQGHRRIRGGAGRWATSALDRPCDLGHLTHMPTYIGIQCSHYQDAMLSKRLTRFCSFGQCLHIHHRLRSALERQCLPTTDRGTQARGKRSQAADYVARRREITITNIGSSQKSVRSRPSRAKQQRRLKGGNCLLSLITEKMGYSVTN